MAEPGLAAVLRVMGPPAPGCPDEVHSRMAELVCEGKIPPTDSATRARQKLTGGESYRYPPELKEAVLYGYIGPNLPPPTGAIWKRDGQGWFLGMQGG